MEEKFEVLSATGEFKNITARREEVHEKGLWHRAVVVFIINSKNEVLLQQRSANKKMWPNLWDISAGGHVNASELGFMAALRETKEEIGIDITEKDLLYIGSCISKVDRGNIKDRHFNDFFVVKKDVNIEDIHLQEKEVQDIKWFKKEEVLEMIKNKNEMLTDKLGCWNYLAKYFEISAANQI